MPYNPGTANHAGALLAQGASAGIHSLADSHRRIGEMLKAEEEKRKQERMKAKGYQALLKADPAMEKIMGERLGLTPDKFMDLSVEEQVAVGDGLMMLPGLTQAFQAIEANNINNVRGGKDLARYDREKALSDALASGQISAVELSNMAKKMGLRGFEDRQAIEDGIMAQNYRRGKAEADMAEQQSQDYERVMGMKDRQLKVSEMNAQTGADQLKQGIRRWEMEQGITKGEISMTTFLGMEKSQVDALIKNEKDPAVRDALARAASRYFEYKALQRKAESSGISLAELLNLGSNAPESGGKPNSPRALKYNKDTGRVK